MFKMFKILQKCLGGDSLEGGPLLGGGAQAQNRQDCLMGPVLAEAHRHKMNRFA